MIVAADRLFPVSSPSIPRGALRFRGGVVTSVGPLHRLRLEFPGERVLSFPGSVIIPGLVNTHTHLEYSFFGSMACESDFLPWIRRLVELGSLRSRFWGPSYWVRSAAQGARRSLAAGITTVGDVVSFGGGLESAASGGPRVRAFLETVAVGEEGLQDALSRLSALVGDSLRPGNRVRPGVSPHSIYTLPPSVLSELSSFAGSRGLPLAVHVAESPHEKSLLSGTGPMSPQIGRWGLPFGPRSRHTFGSYLLETGLLRKSALLVHGVHLDGTDLHRAAESGAVLSTCPRSNLLLRCGLPSYRQWRDLGVRFVYGTDSLASVPSFDLFEEARTVRQILAEDGETILRRLTLGGAEALAFDDVTGSLEPGKAADYAVLRLENAMTATEDDLVRNGSADAIVATAVEGRMLYRSPGASIDTVSEKGLSLPPAESSTAVTR